MNNFNRLPTYILILIPTLFAPLSSLAQSPFDGTWRTIETQTKPSSKPYIFSLNKGMFDCSTCSPKIHLKADGTDQPRHWPIL